MNTQAPQPEELEHDPTLDGVEQECLFDLPMKAQIEESAIEGAMKS